MAPHPTLSPWERENRIEKRVFLKGEVTHIQERVGYDEKTREREFPLPGGEGRVRGLFPGIVERVTLMDNSMPHNKAKPTWKSAGIPDARMPQVVLYHMLGNPPAPESTHESF